jgi:hypothetical protein
MLKGDFFPKIELTTDIGKRVFKPVAASAERSV